MKIHNVAQGSPEWIALRANHDTASEASSMMNASKKTSRTELLRLKATGSEKEFSSWVQKNLLDRGHGIEKKARPLAEAIIGSELFPCTATSDEHPRLLASFDGVTMMQDTIWECKSWNEAKAALVREGKIPDEDLWQVVEQLVVSRAERCLYMVTDGTEKNTVTCWASIDDADEDTLLRGWKQFNADRDSYTPTEARAEVIADHVEALPAVFVQVSGSVAVQDNFKVFEKALTHFISDILVTDPKDDQDFANLDSQIKALKKAEDALDAAEVQMLAQVQSVNDLKSTKDMLHAMARKHRLLSEKLLTAQKDKIKLEIRQKGEADWAAHIKATNADIGGGVAIPAIPSDFAGVMKNKRTIVGLQDAVDAELARLKVEATKHAEKITTNLTTLRELATGFESLFRDRQELVLKENETLVLVIKERLAVEQKRIDDIRQEEADRIERERVAKLKNRIGELRDIFTGIEGLKKGALEGRLGEMQNIQLGEHWGEFAAEVEKLKAEGVLALTDAIEVLKVRALQEAEVKVPAAVVAETQETPAPASVSRPVSKSSPSVSQHQVAPTDTLPTKVTGGMADEPIHYLTEGTRCEVTNLNALLAAVLSGEIPESVVSIDMLELAEVCAQKGFAVPGVTWSKA